MKTNLVEGFISGGHVGAYSKQLESAGAIIIKAEESLLGGARYIEFQHQFGTVITKKTEFPLSWSPEKIMNSIFEALENTIYKKNTAIKNGKRKLIVGETSDNMKITIILEELLNGNLQLKTAFPYCEKLSGLKL